MSQKPLSELTVEIIMIVHESPLINGLLLFISVIGKT